MKKQTYDMEEKLLEYSVLSEAASLSDVLKSTCSVYQNIPVGHSGLDPESSTITKHLSQQCGSGISRSNISYLT